MKLKGDSLWGFLFTFSGTSELLPLGSLLEFPCGRLGTNFVWRSFGSLLGFAIPGDSFSRIPPCFPPLGFTLIVSFARNSISSRMGINVFLLSWGTAYIYILPYLPYLYYSDKPSSTFYLPKTSIKDPRRFKPPTSVPTIPVPTSISALLITRSTSYSYDISTDLKQYGQPSHRFTTSLSDLSSVINEPKYAPIVSGD